MGRACCVPGCPSQVDSSTSHRFPSDGSLRSAWLKAARLKDAPEDALLCSLHFRPCDSIYTITTSLERCKELLPGTIPSVFPWSPDWASALEMAPSPTAALRQQLCSSNCTPSPSLSPDHNWASGLPEGEAVQLGNVGDLGLLEPLRNGSSRGSSVVNGRTESPERPAAEEKVFQCENCDYSSSSPFRLMKHVQRKHPEVSVSSSEETRTPRLSPISSCSAYSGPAQPGPSRRYCCQYCNFRSADKEELLAHKEMHKTSAPLKCPACSFSSHTEELLKTHRVRDHDVDQQPSTSSSPSKGAFKCRTCIFSAATEAELVDHQRNALHPEDLSGETTVDDASVPDDVASLAPSSPSSGARNKRKKLRRKRTTRSSPRKRTTQSSPGKRTTRSSHEQRKKRRKKKTDGLKECKVYCCDKTPCGFWALSAIDFQEHYIMTHLPSCQLFTCSAGDFKARLRDCITNHIKTKQRKGPEDPEAKLHEDASCVLIDAHPERRYGEMLKMARVPAKEPSGFFSSSGASGRLRSGRAGGTGTPSSSSSSNESSYEPTASSRRDVMEETSVYCCPNCSFWARTIQCFREHVDNHPRGFEIIAAGGGFPAYYRDCSIPKSRYYGWFEDKDRKDEEDTEGSSSVQLVDLSSVSDTDSFIVNEPEETDSEWQPSTNQSDVTEPLRTPSSSRQSVGDVSEEDDDVMEWPKTPTTPAVADDTSRPPSSARSDVTEPLPPSPPGRPESPSSEPELDRDENPPESSTPLEELPSCEPMAVEEVSQSDPKRKEPEEVEEPQESSRKKPRLEDQVPVNEPEASPAVEPQEPVRIPLADAVEAVGENQKVPESEEQLDAKEAECRNRIRALSMDVHDGYRRLEELQASRKATESARKELEAKKGPLQETEGRFRACQEEVARLEALQAQLTAQLKDLYRRNYEALNSEQAEFQQRLANLSSPDGKRMAVERTAHTPTASKTIELESRSVKRQFEAVAAELKVARENLAALSQLLDINRSEVGQLEETVQEGDPIAQELREAIQAKISAYVESEKELARLVYLRKAAKVVKTGNRWLQLLDSYGVDKP